jgi:hypothetical protein
LDFNSLEEEKIGGLKPDKVIREVERTRELISHLELLLPTAGHSSWVFGIDNPTALDAHLVVFIARLATSTTV